MSRWSWLLWAAMSATGYLLGACAAFFLGHFILGNLMLPIGIGAGVGLAQRPALVRFVSGRFDPLLSVAWPVVSSLGLLTGFLLGGAAASMLGVTIPFELSWPAGVLVWVTSSLVGGLAVGGVQSALLRPHTTRAHWWVPVSVVGWGLSGAAWIVAVGRYGVGPFLLAPTLAGLMLGLVTGAAIQRMLPRGRRP